MAKKVGRNDPCPCGSGKKYKHCCMFKDTGTRAESPEEESEEELVGLSSDVYFEPGWLSPWDWYAPAHQAGLHFAEILKELGEGGYLGLEGERDRIQRYKRALERLVQAQTEAADILRERRELVPRPEKMESVEDLLQFIRCLPTLVRSEMGPLVSHWQHIFWPEASSRELEVARSNMSDDDMRRFLRALAE